jgi:hypothetical protein
MQSFAKQDKQGLEAVARPSRARARGVSLRRRLFR